MTAPKTQPINITVTDDINVKVLFFKQHQIHQKILIHMFNIGHIVLKD